MKASTSGDLQEKSVLDKEPSPELKLLSLQDIKWGTTDVAVCIATLGVSASDSEALQEKQSKDLDLDEVFEELDKPYVFQLPPELRLSLDLKKLKQLFNKANSISILVTGKIGTGKSTLINGILGVKGKISAQEGSGRKACPDTELSLNRECMGHELRPSCSGSQLRNINASKSGDLQEKSVLDKEPSPELKSLSLQDIKWGTTDVAVCIATLGVSASDSEAFQEKQSKDLDLDEVFEELDKPYVFQLPPELRLSLDLKKLKQLFNKANSISILVTGKIGTGKSTLINGILVVKGKISAQEGSGRKACPDTELSLNRECMGHELRPSCSGSQLRNINASKSGDLQEKSVLDKEPSPELKSLSLQDIKWGTTEVAICIATLGVSASDSEALQEKQSKDLDLDEVFEELDKPYVFQLPPELRLSLDLKKLKQLYIKANSISIIVTSKIGIGKSTLINSILVVKGKRSAQEGSGRKACPDTELSLNRECMGHELRPSCSGSQLRNINASKSGDLQEKSVLDKEPSPELKSLSLQDIKWGTTDVAVCIATLGVSASDSEALQEKQSKDLDLDEVFEELDKPYVFQLPPELRLSLDLKKLKQLFNKANSISIFVTGKIGTGKSTLINGILGVKGKISAQEGSGRKACTAEVTKYQTTKDKITVTVWDSPGLQDDIRDQQGYLEQMINKFSIYCIQLLDTRFIVGENNPEVQAMKKLTKTLSTQFWRNVIHVNFTNTLKAFNCQLACLPPKESIKVIPANHCRKPHLPGCSFWFSGLWYHCVDTISTTEKQIAMVRINAGRFKKEEDVAKDEFREEPEEQIIIFHSSLFREYREPKIAQSIYKKCYSPGQKSPTMAILVTKTENMITLTSDAYMVK